MGTLVEAVTRANMSLHKMQINRETREIRYIPIVEAAAKKHGPNCRCEACSSLHMKRTRDKRMKAMMPGNVDMGNRQPATMGKGKVKAGGPGSGRRKGGSLDPGENPEFDKALKDFSDKMKGPNAREKDFSDKMKQKRGVYPGVKSDAALMMKKQVPPKHETSDHIKPSSLIHDKGKILKGKHIGFKKMKQKLGHEKGVTNPGGLAYEIGVEKYGKKGMQKKSKAGK